MAGSVFEGKTVDEAVKKGLAAQRLERAEAVITIVEEGKSGFLGIGARPFRVSVMRRPGGPLKEPVEREDRGGRGGRGGRDERGGRGGERGGRGGRGGRDDKPQGRDGGRDGGRGGRDEKSNERGGRGGRDERRERDKTSQPAAAREERGGRGERAERPAREERAPREPRPERVAQAPAAAAAPSPVPPQVSEEGGDDAPRKRRRRGRRGGRGRRRGGEGGEGAESGAEVSVEPTMSAPMTAPVAKPAPVAAAPAPADLGFDADGEPKLPIAPAPKFEGMNVVVHTPAHAAPPVDEPVAQAQAVEPAAEAAPRFERPDRSGRRDRGDRPSREERAPREPRPEGASSPEMSSEELGTTSKAITEDLLRRMGFEPKVEVRTEGNRVDVTVEVERDDHLLTGRGGETRLALQHILNRFLNKGDGSRYHLQLEVNDFWEQRENELAEIARGLADQAVAANAEVVGEPMNSMERRIVHVTLREDARVKTYSLGDGAVKRVAVAPAGLAGGADDSHEG